MMQEPIQDGGSGRDITQQFAPVLQGPIGGHHRGFGLVPPHDDFKKIFARSFGGTRIYPFLKITAAYTVRQVPVATKSVFLF